MIYVAVEGESDKAAARAIVEHAGHRVVHEYVARGKTRLDPKIPGYLEASKYGSSWVVFRDSDGECPVSLSRMLADVDSIQKSTFALRIAHTMTEAWLLADREGFAEYFGVSSARVPMDPEAELHAKQTLLNLCMRSRSRKIREEVVTHDGQTGPLYVARINDFAATRWNVQTAAGHSQSLNRAIVAIRQLRKDH